MFLADLLTALVIGGLLTWIFVMLFGRRGPWNLGWVFLLLVVLGTWVGGLWIAPFGPVWFGVSWLPYAFAGFFIALLLAAATPVRPYQTRTEAAAEEAVTAAVVGTLLWVLVIGLLISVVFAYL